MKKSEIVKQAEQVIQEDKPVFTIVQKLKHLFKEMMKDSGFIPPMLRPTVENLVNGYLEKADPHQVKEIIKRIDEEILPWLLE